MATYDFKCGNPKCGIVQELVQSVHKDLPDSIPCPRCGKDAVFTYLKAPGLMTGNMGHASFDVLVGQDSDKRWKEIHERQAKRNKIRRETGKMHLESNGDNDYKAHDRDLQFVKTPKRELVDLSKHKDKKPS
jgi:rubredoxin